MLFEVMSHVHNFFIKEVVERKFVIEDGSISLNFITDGQYFLVEGSVFNDGVHKYPVQDMQDEVFAGTITTLAPPRAFLDLVKEIEEYVKNNPVSALVSESFGGYSYTKATKDGTVADWKDVFKARLNTWRKI